jgi:hypothetical protein
MPRPYPPAPSPPLAVSPFPLGEREKRDLAGVLGLENLPQLVADGIAHAIACYKATQTGSPDTTIANTIAALDELKKKNRSYKKAVARLADDRSAVDYTTHSVIQPLAKSVVQNAPGAKEALWHAAYVRIDELKQHERIETATESLRLFCGFLRMIFNKASAPELRRNAQEGWRHCRQFALEVFTIADIDHADFDAHPERLTKYLGTEMGGIAP